MSKLEWIKVDDFFDKITKIDEKAIKEVIEAIESKKDEPYDFNYVLWTLENPENWYIHEGDLTLDKSFASEYRLIVKGNLTINGVYDDVPSSYTGNVIVFGDMEADHIYSQGTLTVFGNIKAKGLIYNYYNDCVFECNGKIDCKAFYVDDKQAIFNYNLLTTEFERDFEGLVTGPKITDFFVDEIIDKEEDDEEFYTIDVDNLLEHLCNGKEIFKM